MRSRTIGAALGIVVMASAGACMLERPSVEGLACVDDSDCDGARCVAAVCTSAPVTCGDGSLQAWERCDDGNREVGDGCSDVCTNECSARELGSADFAGDFTIEEIAVAASGLLFTAGKLGETAWVRVHDPDGALRGHVALDGASTGGVTMTAHPAGGIVIAIEAGARLVRLDDALAEVWSAATVEPVGVLRTTSESLVAIGPGVELAWYDLGSGMLLRSRALAAEDPDELGATLHGIAAHGSWLAVTMRSDDRTDVLGLDAEGTPRWINQAWGVGELAIDGAGTTVLASGGAIEAWDVHGRAVMLVSPIDPPAAMELTGDGAIVLVGSRFGWPDVAHGWLRMLALDDGSEIFTHQHVVGGETTTLVDVVVDRQGSRAVALGWRDVLAGDREPLLLEIPLGC